MANDGLLRAIVQAIRRYEKGEASLADTQAAIEANASALEGVSADLRAELREVDADLEHIQHAMPLDEQRSAALVRLGELSRHLASAGAPGVRAEVPEGGAMTRVTYDPRVDAAYVYLDEEIGLGEVERTVPCVPIEGGGEISLDFDRAGRLVGIEVLSASSILPWRLIEGPTSSGSGS